MDGETVTTGHPMRRASDTMPQQSLKMRAVGLTWFFAMSLIVALAGPLFVVFFALGVVSAYGLRWMV